jgi:hypothetical protein
MDSFHFAGTICVCGIVLLGLHLLRTGQPPRETKRITLQVTIWAVGGAALILAQIRLDRKVGRHEVWMEVMPADGDAEALAGELLSPRVLDDAWRPPTRLVGRWKRPQYRDALYRLPRFQGNPERRDELDGLVRLRVSQRPPKVVVYLESTAPHDEFIILGSLRESWNALLGPARITATSPPRVTNRWSRSEAEYTLYASGAWFLLLLGLAKPWRKTRFPRVELLGEHLAELVRELARTRAAGPATHRTLALGFRTQEKIAVIGRPAAIGKGRPSVSRTSVSGEMPSAQNMVAAMSSGWTGSRAG